MELNDLVKFDNYFWTARFFPALICLVPFFVFQYLYFNNLIFLRLQDLEKYSVMFHLLIIIVAIYSVSLTVRGFGKDLIEKLYFIKNNKLPTTQILLGNKNVMSQQQLTLLKSKIKKDFKINLICKCKYEELLLRINDAVDKIRVKVGYKSRILNQYNTEYGFFRNITGGLIIFFPTDLLLMGFSKIYSNQMVFVLSIIMFITGVLFTVFSWSILDNYGTKYAKQLFNEYLVK